MSERIFADVTDLLDETVALFAGAVEVDDQGLADELADLAFYLLRHRVPGVPQDQE